MNSKNEMDKIMNEEQLLLKRMQDLAERAYRTGQFTFTGFLSQPEISIFLKASTQFRQYGYTVSGGWREAERSVIRFGSVQELGYKTSFPICCLLVQPVMKKFADQLTHRDYLGALMNLGIERSLIGDIIVSETEARIFCMEHIAEFIMGNLDKIKHTSVKCSLTQEEVQNVEEHEIQENETVASERLDAIIAKIFKLSRNESLELFRQKKIFVNSIQCENNSYAPKEQDRISVRGYGKIVYLGKSHQTKKGKINIRYIRFI